MWFRESLIKPFRPDRSQSLQSCNCQQCSIAVWIPGQSLFLLSSLLYLSDCISEHGAIKSTFPNLDVDPVKSPILSPSAWISCGNLSRSPVVRCYGLNCRPTIWIKIMNFWINMWNKWNALRFKYSPCVPGGVIVKAWLLMIDESTWSESDYDGWSGEY